MSNSHPVLLAQARAQLPHGAGFHLITELIQFDAQHIICGATIHRENPLLDIQQQPPQLPVLASVEYAAQAAAIHGILLGQGFAPSQPAFVGALKKCQWWVDFLPVGHSIQIEAHAEYLAADGAIYAFTVSGTSKFCEGRLTLARSPA